MGEVKKEDVYTKGHKKNPFGFVSGSGSPWKKRAGIKSSNRVSF
jgi:hypothetical protein